MILHFQNMFRILRAVGFLLLVLGFPGLALCQERAPLAGTNCTVLLFVRTDCPIANKCAPEISRIAKEFTPRGVRFFLVYADNDITPDMIVAHRKSFELEVPWVLEGVPALIERSGATVTPEAAVFNGGREVVYLGRINDQFAGLGQQRSLVTTHDLREALNAVLEGKRPPRSRSKAVGCYIGSKL